MQEWFAPYNFSRSVGECMNCTYLLVLVRYRKSAEVMSLMLSVIHEGLHEGLHSGEF